MPAVKLEHCNIWTSRLDETVRFYVHILGLVDGPRPGSRSTGAWLYDSTDTPVVHLVDVTRTSPEDRSITGDRDLSTLGGSGSIDHVAFQATDYDDLAARLRSAAIPFRENQIPSFHLRQIFVDDPNGVRIELNFRGGLA